MVAARLLALSLVLGALASGACTTSPSPERTTALPTDLVETGLFSDPEVRAFTPQYPLWTDGAAKRRWIRLPRGSKIDASKSDAWQLPVGTKLWKELSFGGKKVETRMIERTPSGWRFASYAWNADGTKATLAPERGTRTDAEVASGVTHEIPGQGDCRVCHGNGETPILGFTALQLSDDRDPNAVHRETPPKDALSLGELVASGRLANHHGSASPRIEARSPVERAALGYLHANCGACHRADGPIASVGLDLTAGHAVETTVDRRSHASPSRMRIARHAPDRSFLLDRMRSRSPATQMPPLGTQVVDDDAVRLMTTWIEQLPD